MNLLRIADVPDNRTGGMSRFMRYGSDELVLRGHAVEHAFADAIGSPRDVRLRRFVTPFRVLDLVRRRLRAGARYDVVEIHEPLAAAYALARRVDRTLPPLLVLSHGLEHRGHETMLAYLRKKGIAPSLKRRVAPHSVFQQADVALRLADQVALSTTEDRAWLADRLRVPAERVTLVHGGISGAFLDAPPPDPAARGVIWLASWLDRKGVRDLVPAMTRVLERAPGLTFTAAGTGAEVDVVRDAFPAAIRARVDVIPRVSGEGALLALYRRHAIFVAPSVFEGQLLTMLEAAGAGLAIVASDRCGMKDFVRRGETGLLVEPGEPDALAAAIERLVVDPPLATRMAIASQTRARTFTWARSAAEYEDAMRAAASRSVR